jgi:hypothetical protein
VVEYVGWYVLVQYSGDVVHGWGAPCGDGVDVHLDTYV